MTPTCITVAVIIFGPLFPPVQEIEIFYNLEYGCQGDKATALVESKGVEGRLKVMEMYWIHIL